MTKKEVAKYIASLNSVAGVNKLIRVVKKLDDTGREVLLKGLSQELTEAKKQQLMAVIKKATLEADAEIRAILAEGIAATYVSGMNFAQKQLRDINFKPISGLSLKPLKVELLNVAVEMQPHLKVVNTLLSDAYLDFGGAMTGFAKGSETILNDALKQQIRSGIATGRLEGAGIREIKKNVIETFKDRGFTVLVDRGGRSWTLDNYAEMLARTQIIKANNEGVINRASDFGVDIVEIAEANPLDSICIAFDKKLFSISGKSENYPKLERAPPYHPNCVGTLLMRPDLE